MNGRLSGKVQWLELNALYITLILVLCTTGCLTDFGEKKAEECYRPGFFGGGGLLSSNADFEMRKFEEKFEGMVDDTNIKPDKSWGFDSRAGYRFHKNGGVEVVYQNFNGGDFENRYYGRFSDYNAQALTVNLKGYHPIADDVQPYAIVGGGVLNWEASDPFRMGLADASLNFVTRYGLGVEGYITPHVVFFTEFTYLHAFEHDLRKFDLWPIVMGLQYRF